MTPIAVRPKFVENIDVSVDILTAYTLDLNTTAQGTISTPTDVDFYKVHLDAGQTYTFALMGTGAHYLADSYLILRNASGTQIALDDDSGPGTNSKLTYTATVTGDYFLDVSGYP
jgi:serralysin